MDTIWVTRHALYNDPATNEQYRKKKKKRTSQTWAALELWKERLCLVYICGRPQAPKISDTHAIVKVCNEANAVFSMVNQYADENRVPGSKMRPWDSKRLQNQQSDNQNQENTLEKKQTRNQEDPRTKMARWRVMRAAHWIDKKMCYIWINANKLHKQGS